MVSGDPLELSKEAPSEEQTRGVLQEPLPDLPGVRREPAETGAVRLSESGQSGDGAGERDRRCAGDVTLHATRDGVSSGRLIPLSN